MKNSKTKNIVKWFATVALSIGVTAAASAADAEHVFKWSHHSPIDSIVDKTTKAIAQEIEEKTDGRIQFKVFPASQLGDWTEVSEQVQRGIIDFATQPVSSSYDKRLQIRVLPYSVMNYAEAKTAYLGEDPYLLKLMSDMMAENEMTALAVVAQGFGGGGFRECPAGNPFELGGENKGLKMRFPPGNQAWQAMVSALGYSPTPVPWGELYLGLQTKLVDAQVGGQPYSTWSNFRDVVGCWVQFNTHFQNSFVFANSGTFSKLSDDDQSIIREVSASHALASFALAEAEDAKYMDLMAKDGIKIIVPSDEELAQIALAARMQVWPVMDEVIGLEIMDLMREKVGIK